MRGSARSKISGSVTCLVCFCAPCNYTGVVSSGEEERILRQTNKDLNLASQSGDGFSVITQANAKCYLHMFLRNEWSLTPKEIKTVPRHQNKWRLIWWLCMFCLRGSLTNWQPHMMWRTGLTSSESDSCQKVGIYACDVNRLWQSCALSSLAALLLWSFIWSRWACFSTYKFELLSYTSEW